MCHNSVVLFVGEKTEYEKNDERKFWNFCISLISILTFFLYITDYFYIYINKYIYVYILNLLIVYSSLLTFGNLVMYI